MTAVAVLGIDLWKNTSSLVGLDPAGAVVLRRRVRREGLLAFIGTLPPCVVAMEARCGRTTWRAARPPRATRPG